MADSAAVCCADAPDGRAVPNDLRLTRLRWRARGHACA
jgi:hypothetical protein